MVGEDAVALDDAARHVAADAVTFRLNGARVEDGSGQDGSVAARADLVVARRVAARVAMRIVAADARKPAAAFSEAAAAAESYRREANDHRIVRLEAHARGVAMAGR